MGKLFYGKLINISYSLGCSPYRWDHKRKLMMFNNSLRRRLFWAAQLSLQCTYVLFLLGQYSRFQLCPENSKAMTANTKRIVKVTLQHILVTYLYVLGLQSVVFATWGSLHHFINSYHVAIFEFANVVGKKLHTKGQRTLLNLYCAVSCFGMIINTLQYLGNPGKPLYITSLFQQPKSVAKELRGAILLLHLNIWCHLYGTMAFAIMLVSHFLHNYVQYLRILAGMRKNPSTEFKFMKEFRGATILKILANSIISNLLGVWDITSILITTLGFYACLILVGPIRIKYLYISMYVLLFIRIIFSNAAEVHEASSEALKRWRIRRGTLGFDKFLKSCSPLAMSVSGTFEADKNLVLTMFAIILDYTVSMVLTIR